MIQRFLPLMTLVALAAMLSVASPHFLTGMNLASLIRQTAVINIVALGVTLVIVAGGIDLSVGSLLALAALLGCMAMENGYGMGVGVAIGLAAGAALGLLNGLLATQLRISPFIVTLGTMGIFRGVALLISGGLPVHGLPKQFSHLAEGETGGAPSVLILLVLCSAGMHFLLKYTRLGRYAFAIGSNPEAAYYSGVPVAFHTTAAYSICGLLTGLAGMVESSRLMTGQPTAGQGYELQAIAAVVIGGGSLRGGEGGVGGTLIGAMIMGLLANGSDLLGISPYLQQAIIGAVIILAVFLDEIRKRRLEAAN